MRQVSSEGALRRFRRCPVAPSCQVPGVSTQARPSAAALMMAGVFAVTQGLVADQGTAGSPVSSNTSPPMGYVGSAACARCHPDIYDRFLRTDMGQSLSEANTSAHLAKVKSRTSVYDKERGSYFDVFRDGDELYQSEYALDAEGHELYRHREKLAYAIGTGENGWTYLVERGNYLFQAPLSYYAKTRAWGLSPGHELGFNRAITTGCIVCHSGRAQPVPHRDAAYQRPAFTELAIGCENCHGPGHLHVEERPKSAPLGSAVDSSIVNPAKLPTWLADNICMFCHQEGDARVLQPGKDYLDFRPGTPLHQTIVIFSLPAAAKSGEQSPLLNHYSLMISSRCYRDSGRKLSCLTCHDPHVQPAVAEAPDYYRSKCLTCHTEASCKLSLSARRKQASDDCANCHMPRKQLETIAHSALTDHRIVRRPGEVYEPDAPRPSTPGLSDLIDLDAEPDQAGSAVSPLTALIALRQLADRGEPYKSRYLAMLSQVAPSYPDNPLVLGMLARKAVQDGTPEGNRQVMRDLSRAIQSGSTWPSDYDLLGTLLLRVGRPQEAADVVGRGIALAPYTPSLYPLMADCDEAMRKTAEAIDALKRGIVLFPEASSMRAQLARVESASREPASHR
jgi:hypothetical protein